MAIASQFEREAHTINGVKTVVLTAGQGTPLVFLHGAGTWHGFNFALPWTEKYKVYIPFHPGFGESGDDLELGEMHDYVLHYLDLFDALKIDRLRLIGFSLGGLLAAKFAVEHGHRIDRLVLVGPAGLRDKAHPMADVLKLTPEQIVPMLVSNFEVIKPYLPTGPDPEFMGARYREGGTLARLLWEHPFDRKLPRYLHRLTMPTLLLWGKDDRIIPVQQVDTWRGFIPNSQVALFEGAGHLVLDEKREAVAAVQQFLS